MAFRYAFTLRSDHMLVSSISSLEFLNLPTQQLPTPLPPKIRLIDSKATLNTLSPLALPQLALVTLDNHTQIPAGAWVDHRDTLQCISEQRAFQFAAPVLRHNPVFEVDDARPLIGADANMADFVVDAVGYEGVEYVVDVSEVDGDHQGEHADCCVGVEDDHGRMREGKGLDRMAIDDPEFFGAGFVTGLEDGWDGGGLQVAVDHAAGVVVGEACAPDLEADLNWETVETGEHGVRIKILLCWVSSCC